jgi:hypothetical protein
LIPSNISNKNAEKNKIKIVLKSKLKSKKEEGEEGEEGEGEGEEGEGEEGEGEEGEEGGDKADKEDSTEEAEFICLGIFDSDFGLDFGLEVSSSKKFIT